MLICRKSSARSLFRVLSTGACGLILSGAVGCQQDAAPHQAVDALRAVVPIVEVSHDSINPVFQESDSQAIQRAPLHSMLPQFGHEWQRLAALQADVRQAIKLGTANIEYLEDLLRAIDKAGESLIVGPGIGDDHAVGRQLKSLQVQRVDLERHEQASREQLARLKAALQAARALQDQRDGERPQSMREVAE
jgi:hypothetical protein